MKSWSKSIVALFLAGFMAASVAVERGSREEAVALANKAAAFLKANGKDKAFAEFSNKSGQFVDRDLYVFVIDHNARLHAHGANERLIGRDLMQLRDADGRPLGRMLAEAAKAAKPTWVEYKWPNPTTKQMEEKITYLLPIPGDTIAIAVGAYK